MASNLDKAIGCLLWAAYGDSLGAAVEFFALPSIRQKFGPSGITACAPVFGLPAGAITDDTQMSIATARGLLNTPQYGFQNQDLATISTNIWLAYLDWYESQFQPGQSRAPGTTCTSALASGRMGTLDRPLNNSSGCGAVMRAHPIGLAFLNDPTLAFEVGVRSGVITHGNPNGYIPAGFLAAIIANILSGDDFLTATNKTIVTAKFLYDQTFIAETIQAVKVALRPRSDTDHGSIIDREIGQSSPSGGGWLGHDALAIALYAVANSPNDPLRAVQIAVNHSGDSDSTGSIAGAIVGALHGSAGLEATLKNEEIKLEHHVLLIDLAKKLMTIG